MTAVAKLVTVRGAAAISILRNGQAQQIVVTPGVQQGEWTVYMLGALKLAAAGAIEPQTSAVEALRYVDVRCMGKTGTLTITAFELADVQVVGVCAQLLR